MVDGVNLFELKSLKAVAKWHSNEFVVVIYCEFEYKFMLNKNSILIKVVVLIAQLLYLS